MQLFNKYKKYFTYLLLFSALIPFKPIWAASPWIPTISDLSDPRNIDTDHDGLWDDWEKAVGTDINNPDTDGDGYPDGLEVQNSYSPTSTDTTKIKKRIEANLTTQELAYYFGEAKLDQFAISGGKTTTPTPVGTFSIIMKRPVVHYKGKNFDYPNTQWNLMFKRGSGVLNYYIHGAWWHHKFGHTVSGGCINVPYEPGYMGRLYDWADLGTEVIVNP
jgi:hypothetical protein